MHHTKKILDTDILEYTSQVVWIKGIVHPKMKNVSVTLMSFQTGKIFRTQIKIFFDEI